jgi:peptidoglycan/xylan/chitin deacetylase (PgdA/CDA1 family)
MPIPLKIVPICLLLVAVSSPCPAQVPNRSVALTFDDLPAAGTTDPAEIRSINLAILQSLDRHKTPAIGFVIGSGVQEMGQLAGSQLLDEWTRRGYDLGNHTLSHQTPDNQTAEQFERDILAAETLLSPALAKAGKSPHYFRFPQSHTGDTREKHDAIAAFLKAHGYRIAVCTIDNEDYAFNDAYLKALADNDGVSAKKLRAEYLAYTCSEIDYYQGLHKQIFAREIPQVMLLHVNRLNADLMDQLLALFQQKQYRFIKLGAALSDDAYSVPDEFLPKFARFGPMWAYRWAAALHVQVNGALEPEPPDWVLSYGEGKK